MSEQASLSIRYLARPRPSRSPLDLLMIEQEEWADYTGALTALNMARYLGRLLYSDSYQEQVDCGWDGSRLAITLHIYPLRQGVQFRLAATVGELDGGTYDLIEESESVSFSLSTSASLRHPASSVLATKWLTGPYTTGGRRISPPALAVGGREVISPVPLFGSVALTLQVPRYSYLLTVEGEQASQLLQAGWSEFAAAFPAGGRPVGLAITPPPGAEELAKKQAACGRGSFSGSVKWPDDKEPVAVPKNKKLKGNYCTLEIEEGSYS